MLNSHVLRFWIVVVHLLISLTPAMQAQADFSNLLVDGVILKKDGETIRGKIIYLNQFDCQFNISLADTSGKEIANFSPKDILGFRYSIKDDTVDFLSMVNPIDMGRIFMRRVYDGEYKLFQFLEINYKSTVLAFNATYFIWHNKWIEPGITQEHEMEALLYHFSDCPELEYKIKTQVYQLKDIGTIMAEYEQCKLTDKYEFFYE